MPGAIQQGLTCEWSGTLREALDCYSREAKKLSRKRIPILQAYIKWTEQTHITWRNLNHWDGGTAKTGRGLNA